MTIMSRFSSAVLALLACSACASHVEAQERASAATAMPADGVSIITLGTAGGPPPHLGRAQPATALQIDGRTYLIDAGEGAGYQLRQVGVLSPAIDALFVTHLHWDHTLGLDYIMATGWMLNRRDTLPIYGPPGLDFLVSRQISAVEVGEKIFRGQASFRPSLTSLYSTREIPECDPVEVFSDDLVRVSSTCNSHFAEVNSGAQSYGEDRALSYRFDTKYGAITFTGDTGPSAELEALAMGSDVLVTEIVDLPSIEQALKAATPGADTSTLMRHMSHQHLTPEEIGKLATRSGVRKVILTHFVVGWGFDVDSLADQVREHFDGEVEVGHDLQRFAISSEN